jgi:hypothetical protein
MSPLVGGVCPNFIMLHKGIEPFGHFLGHLLRYLSPLQWFPSPQADACCQLNMYRCFKIAW